MRTPLAALLACASLAVLVPVANAATAPTYCSKVVRGALGTVDAKVNGVTVWHRGVVIHACSSRFRREYALLIASKGVRVTLVRASRQRCVAIVVAVPRKLPRILFMDLAGKQGGGSAQTVGFGNASAAIGSLAVSANCAAAWGQTVVADSGGSTSSIVAKGFGAATSLPATISEIAIVASADDTKNVDIAAAGRGVTVSWKERGARQVASLP